MAKVLFAWELGQGLGHITVLKPLAERLVAAGHEVSLAARDLPAARTAMANTAVRLLPAAFLCAPRVNNPIAPPLSTMAHILHNTAFGDIHVLDGLVAGWRSIFELLQPEMCLFDHSPTALLAARGIDCAKVLVGNGFLCPPLVRPLPSWRIEDKRTTQQLEQDEQNVLANTNHVARRWNTTPLDYLAQLYDVDQALLTTTAELDHYGDRPGRTYTYGGCWSSVDGNSPVWPAGPGKRMFCYLRPFKHLSLFLDLLAKSRSPAIAFISGGSPELQRKHSSSTLTIELQPLDLNQVVAQCDAAVLHGGHGATVYFLIHGKPMLLLPRQPEQWLTSRRIERLGAGLGANPHDARQLEDHIDRFHREFRRFRKGAERIADGYESWRDPARQADMVVAKLQALL